ncbi:PTS sugar transporter subunit IIA, partial [Enterococcus faecalis]|uniref:PTS sugar transporter subunit IIA n=1 Tax=Enterococcus faecalis TaxID=1351 RepID=UPI003CC515FD
MNFLLIRHGPMAEAAVISAEMIMGKQENVRTLSVTHDSTLESMETAISEVYEYFGSHDLMFFCDILGGTPSN